MRLKSREILISIIISVFAIVFASLFYCLSNGNTENGGSSAFEFLYSAFIGVFGSAFVVLLIAVFDYGRAKEDTLRSFYTSVYESAHILRGINYFYYPGAFPAHPRRPASDGSRDPRALDGQ